MLGIQHEIAGSIIGVSFIALIGLNVLDLSPGYQLITAGLCMVFAIYGSNLPDLIDPPFSPFHRSIGHNFVSFFMSFILAIVFILIIIFYSDLVRYISFLGSFSTFVYSFSLVFSSFFISYFLHLLLDLSTPMGLPLFTGRSLLGIIEIPLYAVPIINLVMLIATIIMSLISIKHISSKITGKIAFPLALLPIWAPLGLFGIFLKRIHFSISNYFGDFLLFLGIVILFTLILIGHSVDNSIKKKVDKKINKKITRRYLCRACGVSVEPYQEYCEKCGSKLYFSKK